MQRRPRCRKATKRTSEDSAEASVELKETSLPPKPKETPALCLYHFGALKGPALSQLKYEKNNPNRSKEGIIIIKIIMIIVNNNNKEETQNESNITVRRGDRICLDNYFRLSQDSILVVTTLDSSPFAI